MVESPSARFPSDPLHPDHAMYQRLLGGVQELRRWTPEHCANLAAALYAEVRSRQPHMRAQDIGQVVAGGETGVGAFVFALPVAGYHTHDPDPSTVRFGVPVDKALQPAQATLAPFARNVTIGVDGFLTDPQITHTAIAKIEHGVMPQVNGIVLHRTASSTAASTLGTWWTRSDGTGAHFLIDSDGTVHQTVSVHRQAWHVGAVRSRGEVEGTITSADQRELDAARGETPEWRATAVRAVSRVESTRPYPERYPTNADSVGIEVVGKYNAATRTWDLPTAAQAESIRKLVDTLQNNFGLTDHDVYQHDVISRKTPGEGAGLHPAVLPADPAVDAAGMPPAGPTR
jgi:hypothetical protein